MFTTMSAFETLKTACTEACRTRQACVEGYKQMLASENVSQMMATWRANWEDVTIGKFADLIVSELPKQYADLKKEMNEAGVYLNECPKGAKNFVRVIVTDTDEPVYIYGDAHAYVLGTAKIVAYNHSQVCNTRAGKSGITLLDYSYCNATCGTVTAQDRSHLQIGGTAMASLDGAIECHANGGVVAADRYRRIDACGETKVYARNGRSIYLEGSASLQPLISYNNEQQ